MFKGLWRRLFPISDAEEGELLVRLYSRDPSGREMLAFEGVGVTQLRTVGDELHVQECTINIPAIPDITKATLACVDFPDLEAIMPDLDAILRSSVPGQLTLIGRRGAPLLVVSPA